MSFDAITTLAPVLRALQGLDLSHPEEAVRRLQAACDDATMAAISTALREAHARGELTPKQAGPTCWFGRLARAEAPGSHGQSIDVVDIAGEGAAHAHPNGEVSWCIPLEGSPVFEGATEGWVVLPPASRHVPTVTGGRMLIVYFLPEGLVDWNA